VYPRENMRLTSPSLPISDLNRRCEEGACTTTTEQEHGSYRSTSRPCPTLQHRAWQRAGRGADCGPQQQREAAEQGRSHGGPDAVRHAARRDAGRPVKEVQLRGTCHAYSSRYDGLGTAMCCSACLREDVLDAHCLSEARCMSW